MYFIFAISQYTAPVNLPQEAVSESPKYIEKVEEKTENTEKEFTFNLKVKKGDLELIKIGTYGIDGETKTEKLEGMKFKVYCNTLEKWVKQVGDEVTFGEFKEAQEKFQKHFSFTSDEGVVTTGPISYIIITINCSLFC